MAQTRTLGALAEQFDGQIQGDPATTISKVATLASADANCIGFLANPLYTQQLRDTKAGIVILDAEAVQTYPMAALIVPDPYLVYAQVAASLYPDAVLACGIHRTASVADGATVPSSCQISAGAVIGSGAVLGERVYVGPNACIGADATIGADTRLMANVSIYSAVRMGERCLLHSGAVIGARGFGIVKCADASWINVPQVGSVQLGDDVEVGANSAIDRGAIDNTVISNGVKIDNLVQIGHNVVLGEHTALAGQSGVAGSTRIGARCLIGGRATINGHISICDDVAVTGAAAITHSIARAGVYSGGIVPMDDVKSHRKNAVRFRQLDKMARRLIKLESEVFGRERNRD